MRVRISKADGGPNVLHGVVVEEVSVVDRPANQRTFLLVKSEDGSTETDKAEWTTAYVNTLPDSSFLYVESGDKDSEGKTTPRSKRHFPYRDANGKVDLPHLRNAIARIPQSNAPGLDDSKKTALQDRARSLLEQANKSEDGESTSADATTESSSDDVAKAGRKISSDRYTRLRQAHDALGKILGELEDVKTDDKAVDDAKKSEDETVVDGGSDDSSLENELVEAIKSVGASIAKIADTVAAQAEQIAELRKQLDAAKDEQKSTATSLRKSIDAVLRTPTPSNQAGDDHVEKHQRAAVIWPRNMNESTEPEFKF